MEHFIRTAFWIVCLSGWLQTESQPISDFGYDYLQEYVKCPEKSTFYTPKDVKTKCLKTALGCILKEFKGAVKDECDDPNGYVNMTLRFLEGKLNQRSQKDNAPTNSTECECELWPTTQFSEFVKGTLNFLQMEITATRG